MTKSERRSSQKEKLQSEYERLQEEISAERDNHNLVLKAKDTEMFKLKLQRDALQIKLDSLETVTMIQFSLGSWRVINPNTYICDFSNDPLVFVGVDGSAELFPGTRHFWHCYYHHDRKIATQLNPMVQFFLW